MLKLYLELKLFIYKIWVVRQVHIYAYKIVYLCRMKSMSNFPPKSK